MQTAIDSFAPHSGPTASRSKWFWVGWGAVAASQLVAFWLLCNQQVRVAEARRTEALVQQLALAECLQSVPRSTMASCKGRMVVTDPATTVASPAAGVMAVSYTVR